MRARTSLLPAFIALVFAPLLAGLGPLSAGGADAPAATSIPDSPAAQTAAAKVFRSVRILPAERSVMTTGWVNQVGGQIELLACGPAGKTHESIFVLTANPFDVQAAMLLLGVKPGGFTRTDVGGRPEGPGIEIWVDWQVDGSNRSERAETFIMSEETGKTLPPLEWVFNGSVFVDGHFMATADEGFVATYWDPYALFNLGLPCGSNDEVLSGNEGTTPPEGTPVSLRFKVPKSAAPPR